MRTLLLLVILAGALLTPPAAAQRPVDELKDLILEQKDAVELALFAELASHGDEDALDALEKVLGKQKRREAMHAAIAAFAGFRGGEAEAEAVGILDGLARKGRGTPARVVAAQALVAMDRPATDTLHELVLESRDAEVRAVAADALAPWMCARGELEDIEAVLLHALPSPTVGLPYVGLREVERQRLAFLRHDQVLVRSLAAQEDPGFTALYAERLVERGVPAVWRRVLVEVLAPRPGPQVARALLEVLEVRDPEVRLAAMLALDGREDWHEHVERLQPLLKSEDPRVRRGAALRMGRFGVTDARWRDEVLDLAEAKDSAVRMGAAAVLADLRTPEAIEALHALLADESWQVRVEAIQAVERLRRKDSVPLLITRLEAESGRMKDDIHMALRLMTGEDFGIVVDGWRRWWDGEGERFEMPDYDSAVARDKARREKGSGAYAEPTFYGIRVTSERVTFVLDVSGSMAEEAKSRPKREGTVSDGPGRTRTRLDVAKEELYETVRSLPEDTLFNLVFFETAVEAFAETLQRMRGPVRNQALSYVRDQWPQGATALYPALQLAFADPVVDTIYLLSDGHPTEGELTDYAQIREQVKQWNVTRKVRVHGIAIGMDSPLLEWLADDTGGEYRRVD